MRLTAQRLTAYPLTASSLTALRAGEAIAGFNPLSLSPDVFFDFSRMSTLFQDAAGTIPVTAVGQPVGRANDLSGNDRHATQSTSADRPTYARLPAGGRRNELTATESLSTQSLTVTAQERTLSFMGTGTVTLSGASTAGPLVGTGASNRVSVTFTPTAASLTLTVSGSVLDAQLELGSEASNYQNVVADYDITESESVTKYGLLFTGSTSSLETASIDLTGTDATTLFASFINTSDATGRLLSHSTSAPGRLELSSVSNGRVQGAGGGSIARFATSVNDSVPYNRPAYAVTRNDVSEDVLTVTGTTSVITTTDQGTGSNIDSPLTIGNTFTGSSGFVGYIFSAGIFDSFVSDKNTISLENWLSSSAGNSVVPYLGSKFSVNLWRDGNGYQILESGPDYLTQYSGDVIHVAKTGNDSTGDGSSGSPYASLIKAIDEASSFDRVSIQPGEYAMPSGIISKNIAFVAPSGGVYFGEFFDLSTSSIGATDFSGTTLYNVTDPASGQTVVGVIRKDTAIQGVNGSTTASTNTQCIAYQDLGVLSVFLGGTSSNVSMGDGANLSTLVSGGDILAWTDGSTQRLTFSAGVYIGSGITCASNSGTVLTLNGGRAVLDRCEIYGGQVACIDVRGSAQCLQFGTKVCGSRQDNIDYDDTCVGVESGITSVWPGSGASDNASTGHGQSKVLRVGGEYAGGSRTIHDVNDTESYVFSCTIRDALFGDATLLLFGASSLGSETVSGAYGDVTFSGSFTEDLSIDSDATVSRLDLSDPWPLI